MRVSFVTDTYPPDVNGVANTLNRLRGLLRDRGHTVDLVLPGDLRDSAVSGGQLDADEPAARLKLGALPVPGYPGLRFGLPSRQPLRAHWSAVRPNIIYVATESPLGFSAVEAAEDLGIPRVSGFHTNFDHYMRDYKLPMLKDIAGGYLKHLHNRTAITFAPSPDVLERLDAMGFTNTRLLGRGVDTSMFSPAAHDDRLRAAWGAGPDDCVALCVGRIAPEKNLPLAREAARGIDGLERAAGRSCRLIIVGDGPKMSEFARAWPDVVFAGTRTGADLARHYASADVFLFPSLSETFGNVITEALASGLVVVAHDYAAARLHIRHGHNGLVASPGDAAGFLAIARAAADRAAWPALRAAARATSLGISWDAVADQFAADLAAVVAASTGGP